MDKFQMAIRWIICLALLFLWTGGCEEKAKTPAKPKVVTKKITSSKVAAKAKPAAKKPAPAVTSKKVVVAKKVTPPAAPKPKKVTAPKPTPVPAKSVAKAPVKKAPPPAAPKPAPVAETPTATDVVEAETAGVQPQQSLLIYSPIGKIDPFQPLLAPKLQPAAVAEGEQGEKPSRPLTDLEKLDLGQLKLTATIIPSAGTSALAMVEEKRTSKGYVVRKGTFIGTNSGQIVEILSDRIVIEEEIRIGGVTEVRQRELKIQKPGER